MRLSLVPMAYQYGTRFEVSTKSQAFDVERTDKLSSSSFPDAEAATDAVAVSFLYSALA
jgi:hypothetical protein